MKLKQFVIIGLGRFGSSLGRELVQSGYEVLGIDEDEEKVDEMSGVLTHAVMANGTDEEVLRSVGVRNFDCGIVAIGSDIQASILAAILLKDMGVGKVVAKAVSELHGRVLEKIGVDRVVYPERDMGVRVAHQLVSPNLLDYIELSKKYTIAELVIPECLSGKTLAAVNPRGRFGCSIVAINKPKGMIVAPVADDVLIENDVMVVIGTNQQIEQFQASIMK